MDRTAAAIGAGVLVALIHAVACIRYRADQVVVGTAINILMIGLPGFLSGAFFLSSGSTPQIPIEQLIPRAPIVMAFAFVPLTWYVLYRTPFGLRLRAVGENPEAADAAGVNVARIRYSGVLLSGALAAIGGAYLSIGQSSLFTRNMTSGRGFIALAALIFGKWRPVQTLLACLFFGFTEAITIQMQGVVKLPSGEDIPVQFIQMVPYVLTIVVLAGLHRALTAAARAGPALREGTVSEPSLLRSGAERRRTACDRSRRPFRTWRSCWARASASLRRASSAPTSIRYGDIPHWPASNVVGHEGRLVIGEVAGRPVAALSGRAHFYGATICGP